MVSFYGNGITKDFIAEVLGFEPTTYTLTRDEDNGILILQAANNNSFSNQTHLFSFENVNNVPTLFVTIGEKQYKFVGEEVSE